MRASSLLLVGSSHEHESTKLKCFFENIARKVDSEAAEEILRDANIADDVIAGVRALSKGQSVIDEVSK